MQIERTSPQAREVQALPDRSNYVFAAPMAEPVRILLYAEPARLLACSGLLYANGKALANVSQSVLP